jgi:hypothetical protein
MMTDTIDRVFRSLAAAGMALALTAGCDITVDIPDPDVEDDEDSGEEDPNDGDYGPCDEVEACFDADVDPEECFELLEACHDEPAPEPEPEPSDECEFEHLYCLEAGEDPQLCEEQYIACIGEDDVDDIPDEDPQYVCEQAWHECLDAGEDPQLCEELYVMCLDHGTEPDPQEPVDEPDPQDPNADSEEPMQE